MSENKFSVYISCVGESDPVSERGEGPLLSCLRYLSEIEEVQFNTAFLIPSSKEASPQRHTEGRAEECRDIIQGISTQVQIRPLTEVKNPAELKEVYPALRDLLTEIKCEVKKSAEGQAISFHINVSSGTPQMKESLPFLVSVGVLEPHEVHLWQVLDPRHFPELKDRVQPAPELDLLTQERILLRLEQLAEQHMYQEANGWLRRGLTVAHLSFAQKLYGVLTAHDQWLHTYANHRLQDISGNEMPDPMKDWLNEVSEWLQVLAQDSPPKDKLTIDRFYCACRRLESGLYPDAVSHFWTACELALEKHGQEIGCRRRPRESAADFIPRLAGNNSGLAQVPAIVTGGEDLSLLDDVDWLRERRNEIEHGTRPVDRGLAENAKAIAEKVLETLGWLPQQHPLQPEVVKEKLLQLIRAMRNSLWTNADLDG